MRFLLDRDVFELDRLKRDTVRPKDRLDAEVLRERFDLERE
jgi:hypothetical protein